MDDVILSDGAFNNFCEGRMGCMDEDSDDSGPGSEPALASSDDEPALASSDESDGLDSDFGLGRASEVQGVVGTFE